MSLVKITVKLDKLLPEPPSMTREAEIIDGYIGFYDRDTNEEYYIDNQFAGWSQLDNSSGVDTSIKLEYIDCVFRKWDGEHGEAVKLTEELWSKLKPAAYPFSIVNQSDHNKVYANAKEAKIEILFEDFKKVYTTDGESCYV